jgi:hypothetical protein
MLSGCSRDRISGKPLVWDKTCRAVIRSNLQSPTRKRSGVYLINGVSRLMIPRSRIFITGIGKNRLAHRFRLEDGAVVDGYFGGLVLSAQTSASNYSRISDDTQGRSWYVVFGRAV